MAVGINLKVPFTAFCGYNAGRSCRMKILLRLIIRIAKQLNWRVFYSCGLISRLNIYCSVAEIRKHISELGLREFHASADDSAAFSLNLGSRLTLRVLSSSSLMPTFRSILPVMS
jgi:hypothetical protein